MKKEATEKRKYESPELTAVEFRTERGYFLSGKFMLAPESIEDGTYELEARNDDNHYFWGGGNSESYF